MRRSATILALLLTMFGAGCAVSPTPDMASFAGGSGHNSFETFNRAVEPKDTLVLNVIHDRQTSGPSCGAHALASIVNYWRGPNTITGDALYAKTPPAREAGYSMAELLTLASGAGLQASAVVLPPQAVIAELEAGRPVLVPIKAPSVYLQQRVLPGGDVPVVGVARNMLIGRAARVSEWTRVTMVDHYVVVVGHGDGKWVVVEPVMGYRTIAFDRLERYRRPFGDAAIVFSKAGGRRAT